MQELLIPQYIEANEEELIIAEEQNNTLLNLGFQVVQGGPTQLKIEGLPIDLVESKGEEILRYVFSLLKDYQTPQKRNFVMKCSLMHRAGGLSKRVIP